MLLKKKYWHITFFVLFWTQAVTTHLQTLIFKLNLYFPEANANNPAMSLIEQYSDILLNIMQTKMVNQFSQPQSLPPTTREPNEES